MMVMTCAGLGSCITAGYFDCCRAGDYNNNISVPSGTIFPCQGLDPVEGRGRCYCDFVCHKYLDCCEDIIRICPSKY